MASRYIVIVRSLSLSDRNDLIDQIDRHAFLFAENYVEGYLDVTWTIDEDIRNVIKFPANCYVEKIS